MSGKKGLDQEEYRKKYGVRKNTATPEEIEAFQNDRTVQPDPRMFEQKDQTIRESAETGADIEEVYRQVSPVLEPETKNYIKSRGYSTGDMVCKGKGKAIRGYKFGGCK